MINDKLIKEVFYSYLAISILSSLTATIGALVDGIVIGQVLGLVCVSAFGISSPVVILTAAIAGIFSNGGSGCSSMHMGRGDNEAVRLNFTTTILGTILVGILLTFICVFGRRTIAVLFGAEGELIELTSLYIKGLGVGMIPTMLTQVIMIYIRLNDGAKLSFISVICMTVCNITLDLFFALVLDWGMFGMGLATSISYLVAMLICCIHFFKKNNIFGFSSIAHGGSELVQVFLVGLPSALNRACMSIRGISLNHLLMVLGGTLAVSALAVQNNINQIFSSITMGVGMTAMMLTGVFYGEKDDRALEKTLRVSLKSGVFLSGVTAVAVIIFARPLVRLFLEGSEEGMVLAVRSLRFFCLSLPLPLICVVLINFYQCTKNLLLANVICIGHGLAFVVAVSFAMAPVLGMDAVWISFFCSEVLTLLTVLFIIRVKSGRWPKNWSDLALLPEDFRPSQERILDIIIKNDMEQVMELSSRIHEFCGKYTMDSKKVGKLALCIEEMAGNIVQHGFKDEKMHSIDIRIIMSEETIIFRMRDDGIAFNPIRYADENFLSQEENIGIKLVQKIAKEMSYNNAIGMNNLTIVI